MRESLILYQHLPWVTCLYGAMWTPVVVFDVPVYAEGFDLGEVRVQPIIVNPEIAKRGTLDGWPVLPSIKAYSMHSSRN